MKKTNPKKIKVGDMVCLMHTKHVFNIKVGTVIAIERDTVILTPWIQYTQCAGRSQIHPRKDKSSSFKWDIGISLHSDHEFFKLSDDEAIEHILKETI